MDMLPWRWSVVKDLARAGGQGSCSGSASGGGGGGGGGDCGDCGGDGSAYRY